MKRLFFDTETTGLVNHRALLKDQPYPVQLACVLKEDAQVYAVCNLIVNAGEPISSGAAKAHGITEADLEAYGISLAASVHIFLALVDRADELVAHNIDFDYIIMQAATERITGGDAEARKMLRAKKRTCTMLSAMDYCRLPGRYGNYKWPTLQEAYMHFVDPLGFEGAHDALVDVNACIAVYEAMEAQGLEMRGGRY
jgi:DNA polymerase III subunit epsilon